MFTVTVNDDELDEEDEMFQVILSNPVDADIADDDATGTATIEDDDGLPTLTIEDVEVDEEGDGGRKSVSANVTLAPASGKQVTVDVATEDGSPEEGSPAEAGDDYGPLPADEVLEFEPGQTEAQVSVDVFGDVLREDDETFSVVLSDPVDPAMNAVIADATAEVTILDDDPLPSLSITDAEVVEGTSETEPTEVTLTVTLEPESGQQVMVSAATVAGTARASTDDYTVLSDESITFDPGDTEATVTVSVVADSHPEDDETFSVVLSDPVDPDMNAVIADGTGDVLIIDDDGPEPTLSVADVAVDEADGTAVVAVTLSGNVTQDVSVDHSTVNGTATEPDDYTFTGGELEFSAAGTEEFTVPLVADGLDEDGEFFEISLSNATNAAIADGTAVVTLRDSDDPPTVTVTGPSMPVEEGNDPDAPVLAPFTVSLSAPSGKTITVDYATGAAGDTATAPADYESTSGTLTFELGEPITQTIHVPVVGDTLDEEDEETFTVTLSGLDPDNVDEGVLSATATILDDDDPPEVSVGGVAVREGIAEAVVPVRLSEKSGKTVTVHAATVAGSAKAGIDYVHTEMDLTFGPGVTARSFVVPLRDDTLDEFDETFTVTLSGLDPDDVAEGVPSATVTIVDDDDPPAVSIGDARVVEGDSGRTEMVFAVTLSAPSAKTIQVRGSTVDGSATGGVDYVSAGGVGTLLPGAVSLPARVQVIGDTVDEPDETFRIVLSDPLNVRIGDGTGVGTIVDDDEPAEVLGATVTSDAYRVVDADGNVYVFDGSGQGRLETRIPTSAAVVGVASTPSGEGSWVLDAAGGIFSVGDAEFFGSVPELKRQGAPIGDGRAIDVSATPSGDGYWVLDSRGGMFTFGDAPFLGSVPGLRNAGVSIGEAPIVDVASTPSGKGYWVLDLHGGIFAFGDAQFFGSIPGLRAQDPSIGGARVAAMAPTPSGNGYWIVDTDGGIFAFGDARFFGSIPSLRAAGQDVGLASVLAITPTATGRGYFLVDVAGGVFTFGDARFSGSLPGIGVSTRAVGISAG